MRVSYGTLSAMTGLAQRSCENATRRLVNVGTLRKGGSVKGLGTSYTLLRPEHDPSDVELDPYARPVASTVAGEAAELLRASGQTMKPKRHPKPAREQAPAIRPDRIAGLLEDVAGIEPRYHEKGKRKGERRPVIPYSDKTGDPSAVRAAQRYIDQHGWDRFVVVSKAAAGRHDLTGSTQDERLRLFDRAERLRTIEALLTEPAEVDDTNRKRKEWLVEHAAAMDVEQAKRQAEREQMLRELGKLHDLLTAASSYVTDALHLSADPEHRANVRKSLHEIGKVISPTLTALPNDGE